MHLTAVLAWDIGLSLFGVGLVGWSTTVVGIGTGADLDSVVIFTGKIFLSATYFNISLQKANN